MVCNALELLELKVPEDVVVVVLEAFNVAVDVDGLVVAGLGVLLLAAAAEVGTADPL